MRGQVIGGQAGKIIARQKKDSPIEIGELLIIDEENFYTILQCYDLAHASQISDSNLELISGFKIEENTDVSFFDENLRNYTLAILKPMLTVQDKIVKSPKFLPSFFSQLRSITKNDLSFLTTPEHSLFVGSLRSGSKTVDVKISLDGRKVLSHHVLIPATTGRGKSNLVKNILWSVNDNDYCGMLVLDPHDEYYGRNSFGLKDHPNSIVYYTPFDVPVGGRTLKLNIKHLRPAHFNGAVNWSDAQRELLSAYHKKFNNNWVEAIILERPLDLMFNEATLGVVKRRLMNMLSLDFKENKLLELGAFSLKAGESTLPAIIRDLEDAKTVIVNTSCFSGAEEILVGSFIATEVLNKYRYYKTSGKLSQKPVISIVLEEAPRVLGKEVLESGPNIFSTIAREGRKFNVGLVAITQLPSLIPRQILANMNTKIILGLEMKPERTAIIESASQDLSDDERAIASLDIGEAIITSNFAKFAIPVKIPFFDDLKTQTEKNKKQQPKIDTQELFKE
ncbi:ATP-binding protein [Candidatus Woesearchaeota archaeon]|nr:ATP-binding protein [Candidatus Woesearchaeota archaeon]